MLHKNRLLGTSVPFFIFSLNKLCAHMYNSFVPVGRYLPIYSLLRTLLSGLSCNIYNLNPYPYGNTRDF